MTCIQTIMLRDDASNLNQFFSLRQSPRDINQPGRHAKDTILHGLFGKRSHLIQLLVRWLSSALAHHFTAQTSLRQEMSNMSAGALLIDCVKILRGINRAAATISSDDGCASLQQVIDICASIPVQDRIVTMVMQINKAWADHEA